MIDFKDLIDEIVLKDQEREQDEDKRFHPSSAGYCERQIFLSKIGLKDFSRYVKGSMLSGTILHQWLQEHIKGNGDVEIKVRTELKDKEINPGEVYFEGHADYFSKEVCYDFKTTSNIKFNMKEVKDYHKDQLLVYMAGLKAKKGAIVYIDKRDLSVKQYEIIHDNKRLKELFKKIARVYEAYLRWKKGEIKDVPFDKCGCFQCKDEKLKEISEVCECGGIACLRYYDSGMPILKCEKCGDECEATIDE